MNAKLINLDVEWSNRCKRLISHLVDDKHQTANVHCAANLLLHALHTNPKREVFEELAKQIAQDDELHFTNEVLDLIDVLESITSTDFKLRQNPPAGAA